MKNENDRFFEVVDFLKQNKHIKSYVELSKALRTNKAGISDIKAHRKKLTIENLRDMKYSYPQVNVNYIISGEGSFIDNSEYFLGRLNQKSIDFDTLEEENKKSKKEIEDLRYTIKLQREKIEQMEGQGQRLKSPVRAGNI
jgi:hypothetical protein